MAFSADNRQIVSGSRDKTIKLWNTLGKLWNTLGARAAVQPSFLGTSQRLAFSATKRAVLGHLLPPRGGCCVM